MNALLSIKPKYIDEIIAGRKKYEFRKTAFKKEVKEVWIYASSPEKRLVGAFVIGSVVEDTPGNLWKTFKSAAGIKKSEFFQYYEGTKIGYAIEIEDLMLFANPVEPEVVFPNFIPPQSFWYFNTIMYDDINKIVSGKTIQSHDNTREM
jgi:predicted transcriptional regulator